MFASPSSCPRFLQTSSNPSHALTTSFRNILRPLYLHEWVSNWALSNILNSPFHHDAILPLHIFRDSIIISADSRFYKAFVSTTLQIQCEGHLTFIPVHTNSTHNITIGYCICFASDSQHLYKIQSRPPYAPPYIARFIIDHESNNLLMFIYSVQYNVIILLAFTPFTHYTFILPPKSYSWDLLPDNPPIALQGLAISPNLSTTSSSSFPTPHPHQINHLNKVDLTSSDVEELLSKMTLSTMSPSSSSSYLTTDLSSNSAKNPKTITPTPTMQSYTEKILFQSSVRDLLGNRLFSLGNRFDTTSDFYPGEKQIQSLPYLHHFLQVCDSDMTKAVAPKCAHIYYTLLLSISSDGPLFRTPCVVKEEQSMQGNTEFCELLPNPEKIEMKEEREIAANEEQDREFVLKERRRRNRLSAARSHARKTERLELMEKELRESKIAVTQLREEQERVLQKNRELKILLGLEC